MSILTPHNKSHTAGPQSSPSHMEALWRIRQAYQKQLEQMQIIHVLDTRGSDFLTVIFWEAKYQVGQEVWLHLHACLSREEIRRLSAEETMGVQVLLSSMENDLLSFPVMWELWGATILTWTYVPCPMQKVVLGLLVWGDTLMGSQHVSCEPLVRRAREREANVSQLS